MKLRLIAAAALTSFAIAASSFSASAASQAEVKALTAAVAKVGGSASDAISKASAAGRETGWSSPVSASGIGLSGTWKISTQSGPKGTVTFQSNAISGDFKDFKEYSFLASNKGFPALVVLGPKSSGKWFLPFKKSGTLVLVNTANRRQWIALSK